MAMADRHEPEICHGAPGRVFETRLGIVYGKISDGEACPMVATLNASLPRDTRLSHREDGG